MKVEWADPQHARLIITSEEGGVSLIPWIETLAAVQAIKMLVATGSLVIEDPFAISGEVDAG